jgi:RNA polymerase sigma-70 factor (ECF subfamily)
MVPGDYGAARQLDQYREYLRILAGIRLDSRLQAKCDPSDVVQDALLNAHKSIEEFRGTTEPEFKAWLRKILANTMMNTIQAYHTQKRDASVEHSLAVALGDMSSRLDKWLAADQSTPSDQAMWNERLGQLVAALERLPEDQRQAIELRYLQGRSIDDVRRVTGKSEAAVAGLLRRGLKSLRGSMDQ